MVEFGTDLSITYVMGGLAREFDEPSRMIVPWLDASERSGMPLDPRLWSEAPIGSSYPACMAVKAAQEQGPAVSADPGPPAHRSRHRHVDRTGPRLANAMDLAGGVMTERRAEPAAENASNQDTVPRELWPAYGIDAAVDRMQLAPTDAVFDRA